MSESPAILRLAQLDELRPATLDPAVWSVNLTALAAEQPTLAEELRATGLPETWRPAVALDDFLTYRLEPPGEPAAWLGQTATPTVRARSRLARFDPSGKNPALPTCGAGAEPEFLLLRLPAHVAVFVFEADIRVLAAVLHAHDWSAAIAQGRCILVPPAREYAFLTELMKTHPGLLPPGEILLPDLVPATRSAELRALGERLHRETSERRSSELGELNAHGAFVAAPAAPAILQAKTPRVAVLALRPQLAARRVSEGLARAAQSLGWPVLQRATASPRSVHPLAHCRALADFRPDLTIYVGGAQPRLPLTPSGPNCVWVLAEPEAEAGFPADGTLYLAASPMVADGLRRAGVPEQDLLDWYWACEPVPVEPDAPAAAPAAILVADLPDPRPQTCGIQQSAHQKLWTQLGKIVAQAWETPRILEPAKLLVRAEQACQVEIREPELRTSLLRLIERVLIPAITLEQIAQVLAGQHGDVWALGRGWERLTSGNLKALAGGPFDLPEAAHGLHPWVCVCAGQRDPLGPALLHAAAHGWPLLIHSPSGQSLAASLGNVLQPRGHFEPFADRSALRRSLDSLRKNPQASRLRTEKARQHVMLHHTCAHRLRELLEFLGRPARNPL